jgi:hypothetical protein
MKEDRKSGESTRIRKRIEKIVTEGVIFIPVPQRTILVIGLKEGQVLDTAAYISVTIGRMTWQSLIMNDAKSSPKRSLRRRSLLVLIGQTF